ncbi:MAG: H-type small acid-soluble spore protein [Ignavibacteriales bacterium]
MDASRAKEIMQSPDVIKVLYQGAQVWIQNVNSDNTAEVTYMENGGNFNVPVKLLEESNPLKWID